MKPGTGEPAFEDVVPPHFRLGERIPLEGLSRLRDYLPKEIWDLREVFFFEGMVLEIGPCHRRFPAPDFFDAASRSNTSRLDEEGNLVEYSGTGLPFAWQDVADDDPQAGWKWAWNYRYRYQGSGYRGDFRLHHVTKRGRSVTRFTGSFYLLPMHGVPGAGSTSLHDRYWAGGRFKTPPISRGIAWRQAHPTEADTQPDRSDEIWVYLPEMRRVRRAPPTAIDGLYLPSHERANTAGGTHLAVPTPHLLETPGPAIAASEHTRRGFTGLLLRPNAYRFGFVRVQDVIAPINSRNYGYPTVDDRNFGPSGLSLAHDTWDIRRAVVLRGVRKVVEGQIASVTLYIDALTQQPLYFIARKANNHLAEVGMFLGRFSGEDPLHPKWEGSGKGFGSVLPAAASFYVSGEGGWLRESFELHSDPPSDDERVRQTNSSTLQRQGR